MAIHKVVSYEHLQPRERKLGHPIRYILGRIIRPCIQGVVVIVIVAMPIIVATAVVWALVTALS